jgi:transposase
MNDHQNARLTIHSREQLASKVLHEGLTLRLAAARFNVSAKTAAKWVRRFREGGSAALLLTCPRKTLPVATGVLS